MAAWEKDEVISTGSAWQNDEVVKPAAPTKQIISGPESFAKSVKEEAAGMGNLSKFAIGVHGALNDAAMRLKQLVGRDLTTEETQGVIAHRALRDDSGAALGGNIVGNVAMTGTPAIAAERALGTLAAKALPGTLVPQLGAAAATGAGVAAATQPLLEGESVVDSAKSGALGAVGGNLLARGLGRVARPLTPSAEAQVLMKEGIIPTPGRTAGANTFVGRFEQRLESLPLVGDIIRKGNTRAIEELNRAAVNGSLPGGARTALVGRRAIDEAKTVFDNAYEQALTNKKVAVSALDLENAAKAVKADPDVFIPSEMVGNLDKLVKQVADRIPQSGELSGEAAKKIDSFLGRYAAQYNRGGAAERDLGSAILGVQKEFRSAMAKTIPELKEIDAKYSSFLRVQRAAGATGSKQGIFSPEMLQSSVRAMDPGKAFSRGDAVMQNLSEPAVNVLGRTVPDSGTAGRLAAMGLMGGTAAGNEYLGGPGFITAAALAPLLYSRGGSRYLAGNLVPGQAAVGDALLQLAPLASQIGRAANSR